MDKNVSTFLGRPLRLSKRHTDIRLPLDLSDEELTSDGQTLELACSELDADGWNTKGKYNRASWHRIRFTSASFREDILDFALSKIDSCVERQLLSISERIRSSWEAFPSHLRYWASCWEEGVKSGHCFMLVVVYLTHWYNEFMIQKLLDYQPLTSNLGLLRVSMDMLSTALTLGSLRDRTYDVHRDFLHTVLIFGIPTASVLATALQEQHRMGGNFPASISRSEIIRTLSVLINHLETAAHLDAGARPGDGNDNLCLRAARTFTKVIDKVLDEGPTVPNANVISETEDLSLDLDFFTAGIDGLNGVDGLAGTLYDGVDWAAFGFAQ
jgi:hypothetical protein